MSKLQAMEKDVLTVLENKPETRSDDYLLMIAVCELRGFSFMNCPFCEVIKNHKINGLPNWKSVERARRKVFEKRPDLEPPKIAKKRLE